MVVDETRGLDATSDGDVAAHAVADAILGAAALGDLGELFPPGDRRWKDADSIGLLARVVGLAGARGMQVGNVDLIVIAQTVRVAPHRERMRARLGAVLRVAPQCVSVKATTTDGMGFTGRDEGIAAWATVLLTGRGRTPRRASGRSVRPGTLRRVTRQRAIHAPPRRSR